MNKMKFYTDYPIGNLSQEEREIEILAWDRNKYCTVMCMVDGVMYIDDVKSGYITAVRNGKKVKLTMVMLYKFPSSQGDPIPTNKERAQELKSFRKWCKRIYKDKYDIALVTKEKSNDVYYTEDTLKKAIKKYNSIKESYKDKNPLFLVIENRKSSGNIVFHDFESGKTLTRKRFGHKKLLK